MTGHSHAVAKLQTLVRIPTLSNLDPDRFDTAAFDLVLTEMARLFPLQHGNLELTHICTYGLLFRWPGVAPEQEEARLARRAALVPPTCQRRAPGAGPEHVRCWRQTGGHRDDRTTFAITTLSSSPVVNVIAATATAGVKIRVMVGDTVADLLAHVRKAVDDDRVHIDVLEEGGCEPGLPVADDAAQPVVAALCCCRYAVAT